MKEIYIYIFKFQMYRYVDWESIDLSYFYCSNFFCLVFFFMFETLLEYRSESRKVKRGDEMTIGVSGTGRKVHECENGRMDRIERSKRGAGENWETNGNSTEWIHHGISIYKEKANYKTDVDWKWKRKKKE